MNQVLNNHRPAGAFVHNGTDRPLRNLLLMFQAFIVAMLFSFAPPASAGDDRCGGYTSRGNPLSCCSNGGNCTWWAWRHAKASGWGRIPTGNANQWDDFARANPDHLSISTTPTEGAIGVKNSSPYACGTRKKPKTCDYGHVGVVTGLVKSNGKVTAVRTSQMACGGAYGVTTPTRPIGYYDFYVTKK